MARNLSLTKAQIDKLKRMRLDNITGQETKTQIEHVSSAGAKLVMGNALVAGIVVTDDVSAAGVLVDTGSILRIQTSADTYVAFGTSPAMSAVDVNTSPAIKLPAGYHIVVATDDFIRASAAFTRLEVINV